MDNLRSKHIDDGLEYGAEEELGGEAMFERPSGTLEWYFYKVWNGGSALLQESGVE